MAVGEGRLPAHRVACARLDLQHVHAKVAQKLAAQRADGRREIEDAIAGQKLRRL